MIEGTAGAARPGWRSHLLALALFAALSAAWAAYSWPRGVEQIRNSDTTSVFLKNVLAAHGEGQIPDAGAPWRATDLVRQVVADQAANFRTAPLRELYQTGFDRFLVSFYRVTGDIFLAYKLLVFPLNLVFLVGAYLLFLRMSGGAARAAVLALLASLPIAVPLAGEYAGIGPATLFVRRHLMTAFLPWVLLLFLLGLDRARLRAAAFAAAGLIANLHASGILLVEILLLAWWMRQGFAPRALIGIAGYAAIAVLAGFFAFAAQSGAAGSAAGSLVSGLLPAAQAQWPQGSGTRAIPEAMIYLFYPPHVYAHLPAWLVHSMSVTALALPLPVMLGGRRLFGEHYFDALFVAVLVSLAFLAFGELKYYLAVAVAAWALGRRAAPHPWFEPVHQLGLATFYVAFAGTLAFQAAFVFVDGFPLVHNQLRAARYAGFFVFAWIAVLIFPLDRRRMRRGGKIVLGTLVAIALAWEIRGEVRFHLRTPKDAPVTASLMDAARWVRRNTPADARILVPSTAFGVVAARYVYPDDKTAYLSAWRSVRDDVKRRGFAAYAEVATRSSLGFIVVPVGIAGLPVDADIVYRGTHHFIVKCPCTLP